MTYTNSFEEDRFLSTVNREAEAFKKLIDDRQVRPCILATADESEYGHTDIQQQSSSTHER
jgi:hypothetical protein